MAPLSREEKADFGMLSDPSQHWEASGWTCGKLAEQFGLKIPAQTGREAHPRTDIPRRGSFPSLPVLDQGLAEQWPNPAVLPVPWARCWRCCWLSPRPGQPWLGGLQGSVSSVLALLGDLAPLSWSHGII